MPNPQDNGGEDEKDQQSHRVWHCSFVGLPHPCDDHSDVCLQLSRDAKSPGCLGFQNSSHVQQRSSFDSPIMSVICRPATMDVEDADFYCKYCCDVFQVPVFLACGHSVCSACARNMFDYEVLKSLRLPSSLDQGLADGEVRDVDLPTPSLV